MQILIQIHFCVNGVRTLRKGYFKVNAYKFKQNPDEAVAEVAKH